MRKLSEIYRSGQGVKQDTTLADTYKGKADRIGDADAEKIKEWLSVGMVK